MRAPISVIIPVLNAEKALPATLAVLGQGLEAGLIRELIFTDGGSTDGTRTIAEAAGASWVTGPASRGGQLRRGADVARGDWLLFLHADTVLPDGWSEAILAAFATPKAHYFKLSFDDPAFAGRIVAGWANLRSRLFGLPYGDQGLLIPRTLYEDVGGYPDQPLMEDVALACALRGKLAQLPVAVTTSAERYRQQGWLWRGGRNLVTLLRYFAGASPERLAAAYARSGHPR